MPDKFVVYFLCFFTDRIALRALNVRYLLALGLTVGSPNGFPPALRDQFKRPVPETIRLKGPVPETDG